jgi:hypothetical protein
VVAELLSTVGEAMPPLLAVAEQDAVAPLDLHQEEALGSDDEEVDLVHRAVVGDELQVRPGPVGLMVGKSERMKTKASRSCGHGDAPSFHSGGFH